MSLNREAAHAKLDEVFDELEKLGRSSDGHYDLERISLQAQTDGGITGCVLVKRPVGIVTMPYVTWGLSPYGAGLHSGHYDLDIVKAEVDWSQRAARGW